VLFVVLGDVLEPVVAGVPCEHGVAHGAAPLVDFDAVAPFVGGGKGGAVVLLIEEVAFEDLQREGNLRAAEGTPNDAENGFAGFGESAGG